MLIIILLIVSGLAGFTYLYYRIILKNAEIDMLKENICYDKTDLQKAWNGGFVEGVNSERGHPEKNFHEWYQMHKFTKRYGK